MSIVVGILNATPDSFYDGGKYSNLVDRAHQMMDDGADWIDIGGESTRPNSEFVSEQEELDRVLPVFECIQKTAKERNIRLSIDTTKPKVAILAHQYGATVLNDVQGLRNPVMGEVSALFDITIVMHSRATPKNMQQEAHTTYENIVEDVIKEISIGIKRAQSQKVFFDPGIGFAKTAQQSIDLLRHTQHFINLGYPVLIGTSRKSFIGKALQLPKTEDRLIGSLATVAYTYAYGASAWRVHDVKETRQMVDMLSILHDKSSV
jgi:dihydropteroate synthase